MKKWLIIGGCIFSIFLSSNAIFASEVSTYGDVDGNGAINLKDVVTLRRFLSEKWPSLSVQKEYCDVDENDLIDENDVILLRKYFAGGWNIQLPTISDIQESLDADLARYPLLSSTVNEHGIRTISFSYGKSQLDRELVCWCIEPKEYERTILLNFAIHGWEDEYPADGALLEKLGNQLVENYAACTDMKKCRLLIIPSSNPDGLQEGITNNGFGRCNALGIDLNRDFDASHVTTSSERNYTEYPFSAVESRALRDLVLASNPNIVIDFHGWLNYTLGSSDLAEVFSIHTGLNHKRELTTDAHGYFSYWAQLQGAEAMLVEFKDSNSIVTEDVISVIDKLITNNYGDKQTDFAVDQTFVDFDEIKCYAVSSERIYTQKEVGDSRTDFGYIDGANDLCTIKQVYENGWALCLACFWRSW